MGREAVAVHGADSIYLHPMEFRSATGVPLAAWLSMTEEDDGRSLPNCPFFLGPVPHWFRFFFGGVMPGRFKENTGTALGMYQTL